MQVWLSLFLLILLMVRTAYSLALCGEPENVKVAVTMSVLGSIVKKVGGDLIEVESLLPPNIDPHSYEPNLSLSNESHMILLLAATSLKYRSEFVIDGSGESGLWRSMNRCLIEQKS